MWSIALQTLIADRGKLFTALVGVVFSVVLVNVQGGLFLGLIFKASLLVVNAQADIWVGHRAMHIIEYPRDIPRRWVYRVRPIPGVKRADPYLIGFTDMTLPDGGFEGVAVVGVDRHSQLGRAWNLQEGPSDALQQTDGIVVDVSEDFKIAYPKLGEVREVGHKRARVVGKSHGMMGFQVAPYVFTNYDQAASFLNKDPSNCSYILVELEPGANVEEVCASIRERVPNVDAFPSQKYGEECVNFWLTRTGLGISFGASTILGILVGLVMVAQTLYAMVLDRLVEFGTLKAIGATEWQVFSILLIQAVLMAVVGSLIGLQLVTLIQSVFTSPAAPIVIPLWLSLTSCALVLVICLGSSLIPYLRVRKVDPLIVLQA
ncbi:MAG TPA: ABC transporter permease [Pirellulaceae bacterium]|nr:ABC transporter permease [Pirellulaceae bacterium]